MCIVDSGDENHDNASDVATGIYLISDTEELPIHDCVLVSRYISNPLLIDGVKFDLRIYVAVTNFDPLVAYIYEEGAVRERERGRERER